MVQPNHYQTLNVNPTATQAEIKQAYRRLAKQFHPDVARDQAAGHEHITRINAAYEVLGDRKRRQSYDQYLAWQTQMPGEEVVDSETRYQSQWSYQERAATAQKQYQQQRHAEQDADAELKRWIKQVYTPVSRLISQILSPLEEEINCLSADPFDDDLMADFQAYVEDCRTRLGQAQDCFSSIPNPTSVAGIAAHFYYCLNHIGDGLDELERFTLNYDEHYLHVGQEMFRIAKGLKQEAQASLRQIPRS